MFINLVKGVLIMPNYKRATTLSVPMPGKWKLTSLGVIYVESDDPVKCFKAFHPEMSSNEIALGLLCTLQKSNAVEFIDDKVKAQLIKLLQE
jgi:hypothetical protein